MPTTRVPRKTNNPGHHSSNLVSPPKAKIANNDSMIQEEPKPEDLSQVNDVSEEADSEGHPKPSGSERETKKLKTNTIKQPRNCYLIQCVVEKLDGNVNVLFFKNPTKNINTPSFEPFMPNFNASFGRDFVERELRIVAMGSRCDSSHQFIPNKKGIKDVKSITFGWFMFLNDDIEDAGNWALHVCNVLNEQESYKQGFDPQKTSDRLPFFQVLDDITEEPKRKLDQVMMDRNIVLYLCNKFDLNNYGVRRHLKTDEAWNELLQPYFQDVKRGREEVEKHLRKQATGTFNP